MVAFRDIEKKTNDVLRIGYCHDKPWQVAVNHSGDNPKFSAFGTVTNNMLDAAPSVRYSINGLTVNAKAGSTGVSSVDLKYEFPKSCAASTTESCTAKVLPIFTGLTIGSKLDRKFVKSVPTDSTEMSMDYKRDIFEGNYTFMPHSQAWTIAKCLTFDKLAVNSSFSVGGQVGASGKDLGAANVSLGAAYSWAGSKPWTLAVKTSTHETQMFGKLTGSLCAASDKGHHLAAQVCHTIPTCKTQVTLGGLMYLSPKRDTWVKAKLLPDAKVATVLSHKFSDNLTGSFGCQFSAMQKDTEALSYGMKLAMTA